jgi:hypothetical protein
MPREKEKFASEAALVEAFLEALKSDRSQRFEVYPETAGFDLLLVEPETEIQIGIEAKLTLNAKVLAQALPYNEYCERTGPDYRAVLVPSGGVQRDLSRLANLVGLTILSVYNQHPYSPRPHWALTQRLPDESDRSGWSLKGWHPWLPIERCKLPDYVPDVRAGIAAPVQLTQWKIKAIKLMIVLDRRGYVTRRDMKALEISATRWTDRYHGFLMPGPSGYVRCNATPDLKAQHPINYAQIEADIDQWASKLDPLDPSEGQLFGEQK